MMVIDHRENIDVLLYHVFAIPFCKSQLVWFQNLSCPFNDNCNITSITRKFCQKCRLEKCLKIGMKKEWIMSDKEKQQKRAKYLKNKSVSRSVEEDKKLTKLAPSEDDTSQESEVSLFPNPAASTLRSILTESDTWPDNSGRPTPNLGSPGTECAQNCSHFSKSSLGGDKLHSSQYNIFAPEGENPPLIPYSVMRVALESEFSWVPIRILGYNPQVLSDLESSRINELVLAGDLWDIAIPTTDPSLLDIINMTDQAIRRLIKMSKKIAAFKTLCQEDQIALLKGGCTELMILRSVMSYNPTEDCWQNVRGYTQALKMEVLKQASNNVYEEHKKFICSFDPEWRNNETIMLLLSAIALFTPERANTIHKDAIKMEQDTYYFLLRRYLETQYSGCKARCDFLRLIRKIQELHILNENHIRIYMDVNPKDVEPLLIEIFDLKNCSSSTSSSASSS
ncbi:Hr96 [Cordylochernes scorpioides]|uniref:Hr96 n=1 Tax=Cordylochernes scorpioides TaxID=51811 RepID=A0ABY6JYX3_9ARAC|nr:Hr96 [Cordylochernes scorpioides]